MFASGSTAKTIEVGTKSISYLNFTFKNIFKKFISILNKRWFGHQMLLLVFQIVCALIKSMMISLQTYIRHENSLFLSLVSYLYKILASRLSSKITRRDETRFGDI